MTREELEARLAEAVAVVRLLEWSGEHDAGYWICPVCGSRKTKKAQHKPDCGLFAVLAKKEAGT